MMMMMMIDDDDDDGGGDDDDDALPVVVAVPGKAQAFAVYIYIYTYTYTYTYIYIYIICAPVCHLPKACFSYLLLSCLLNPRDLKDNTTCRCIPLSNTKQPTDCWMN